MKRLFVFSALTMASLAAMAEPAECAGEATLVGRADILKCEQWSLPEPATKWWQLGWKSDGAKTSPVAAAAGDVTNAEVVNDAGCMSGACLKVTMAAYQSGAIKIHWPLANVGEAPDEIYGRYYLTLGPTFNPNLCESGSTVVDNGGKFPGFADVRTDADPSGQCGNGGNSSNGINCWSARLKFRNCTGSGNADICDAGPGAESTRLGFYWYLPPASGANNQMFGAFDNQSWGTGPDPGSIQGDGSCGAGPLNAGSTGADGTSCGKGAAGLTNSTRYRVELHHKMNAVGQANGVARAWIIPVDANGYDSGAPMKYEKTNMEYRVATHDNLHVRTFWLNVHAGGEFMGLCTSSYVLIDQLVIAKQRVGAFRGTGSYKGGPFTMQVN